MAKMTERELSARDAKRDIGAELLAAVREMKSGRVGRVHKITVPAVADIRVRSGLSQDQFARLMGISRRTLQDWEQGRRQPSGAARTLLTIAVRRPDVLREALESG